MIARLILFIFLPNEFSALLTKGYKYETIRPACFYGTAAKN